MVHRLENGSHGNNLRNNDLSTDDSSAQGRWWREWRLGYVGWYHRLFWQYLWRSNSTWMIPVHVQGRWREQKLNVVIPVGDSLSGSACWTWAHSPFLLPPLTLHLLEQSTDRDCSSPLGPLSGFLDSWMHPHPFQCKSSIHHLIHHSISS